MSKRTGYPQLSITQDRHCWMLQISTLRGEKPVSRDTYYMEAELLTADTATLTYNFTISRYRSTRWTFLDRMKVLYTTKATVPVPASTSTDPDRETADRLHIIADNWLMQNNI